MQHLEVQPSHLAWRIPRLETDSIMCRQLMNGSAPQHIVGCRREAPPPQLLLQAVKLVCRDVRLYQFDYLLRRVQTSTVTYCRLDLRYQCLEWVASEVAGKSLQQVPRHDLSQSLVPTVSGEHVNKSAFAPSDFRPAQPGEAVNVAQTQKRSLLRMLGLIQLLKKAIPALQIVEGVSVHFPTSLAVSFTCCAFVTHTLLRLGPSPAEGGHSSAGQGRRQVATGDQGSCPTLLSS